MPLRIHSSLARPMARFDRSFDRAVPLRLERTRACIDSSARTRAHVAVLSAVLVASFLVPVRALAEATVVVELKRPDGSAAEGSVQLTKGDSKYSCNTDKTGRCELRGVVGGMYTVNVEQQGRPAAKEKTVVIPPTGEVKLIVNAS